MCSVGGGLPRTKPSPDVEEMIGAAFVASYSGLSFTERQMLSTWNSICICLGSPLFSCLQRLIHARYPHIKQAATLDPFPHKADCLLVKALYLEFFHKLNLQCFVCCSECTHAALMKGGDKQS